ncbi:hypothetical protein ACJJTC_007393 [Scirpophaga incertulas]
MQYSTLRDAFRGGNTIILKLQLRCGSPSICNTPTPRDAFHGSPVYHEHSIGLYQNPLGPLFKYSIDLYRTRPSFSIKSLYFMQNMSKLIDRPACSTVIFSSSEEEPIPGHEKIFIGYCLPDPPSRIVYEIIF